MSVLNDVAVFMLHIGRLHTGLLHWKHKRYQNLFVHRVWFISGTWAQRWNGWTCCGSVMNTCSVSCPTDDASLLTCATVTGWAVPHVYCLHPQHWAVQAEFFLDFVTLTKALHSLKHHKLLTQQQCHIPVALYLMNIFALIKPLTNRRKIVWHYTTGCAIRQYLTESSIMLVTMSILILHMHP